MGKILEKIAENWVSVGVGTAGVGMIAAGLCIGDNYVASLGNVNVKGSDIAFSGYLALSIVGAANILAYYDRHPYGARAKARAENHGENKHTMEEER
jgi:hypothetical protein